MGTINISEIVTSFLTWIMITTFEFLILLTKKVQLNMFFPDAVLQFLKAERLIYMKTIKQLVNSEETH